MLEVSHNATSIGRGCWKKYQFNYLDCLSPIKKSTALTLGSVIHTAFEKYYSGETSLQVLDYISKIFDEETGKVEVVDQEEMVVTKYTALGMWGFYPYKDLNEFSACRPEVEFSVPLDGRRGVRFVGRVDGLVKKDGLWWVREVKTTGLTPRQFKGRCATSSQVTGYIYAMRKLGFDVKGVLFDTIKKPLIRKRVNDTQDTFGQRIMADYRGDLKAPENGRKAYLRHSEYRSETQIQNWINDTGMFVDDLRGRIRSNKWYRNPDNCWKFNSLCPYHRICEEQVPDPLTLQLYFKQKGGKNGDS